MKNKTPDGAPVIAQSSLTLADRSQEKLLKSINGQLMLSCALIGIFGHVPNHPCSQLSPTSSTQTRLSVHLNVAFLRNLSQALFYKFFRFYASKSDINQHMFHYVTDGQTVDCCRLFGQSPPLFGLYQSFFSASLRSIALRLTEFFCIHLLLRTSLLPDEGNQDTEAL
jgi:hypothetical protein